MPLDVSLQGVLGIAAGLLVITVGAFVLVARPMAGLHRLFFVLALMDGTSTILTRLRSMTTDADLQVYFQATGWYFQIATAALTLAFALLFPRPILHDRLRLLTLTTVVLVGAAAIISYVVAPSLHWHAESRGDATIIVYGPLGVLEHVGVVLITLAIAVRLTLLFMNDASASHRKQGALFLAGFLLNEGPYPTTEVASNLHDIISYLAVGPWFLWLDHATRLVATLVLIVLAVRFALERRAERVAERRLVLAGFAGVLLLTVGAFLFPTAQSVRLLRIFGVVAYPVVLAYAVLRFELFDIDSKLRRAAMLSMTGGGLIVVFIVAQNLVENAVQTTLLGGIPSSFAAGSVAALATAALSIPVSRFSRGVAKRVVPELSHDDLHRRKLEVYRHSVEGALADGIVVDKESRMLAALRESLALTQAEHEAIVADVRASAHA